MNLDDFTQDNEDISGLRRNAFDNLSEMSARELAYHIKIGDESQRIIYRSFLETQPDEYRDKVEDALADPLLGESEGDEFIQ